MQFGVNEPSGDEVSTTTIVNCQFSIADWTPYQDKLAIGNRHLAILLAIHELSLPKLQTQQLKYLEVEVFPARVICLDYFLYLVWSK